MKKLSFIIFSLSFLLIIGCAEKPKTIGSALIDPNDVFSTDTISFFSFGETSYRIPFAPGFGVSNLAGKTNANDEAIALFRFIPPSAIDSLKGAIIDTAEMRLVVNYRLKANGFPIQFDVKKINASWAQNSFTYDSLTSTFIADSVLGTFSNDSMNYGSTAVVQLNTTFIRRWADSYIDTGNHDEYYGFAVQAKATNGIIGFATFSSFSSLLPSLLIKYTKNGVKDSIAITSGEDTYATRYTTTPTFTPIVVRGGFGVRSKINFAVDTLKGNPIINNATMELTLDTTASILDGFSPDSVIALLSFSNTVTDSSADNIYVYGFRKSNPPTTNPVYIFNLTGITQLWVNKIYTNFGASLRWAAELGTADQATFFPSSHLDVTKRPILKVTYSKK